MDKYLRKYFFEEIETILNDRPVEEVRPVFIYFVDGLPTMLHESGNKAIGNILGLLESIFGYIGESDYNDKENDERETNFVQQ